MLINTALSLLSFAESPYLTNEINLPLYYVHDIYIYILLGDGCDVCVGK